MSDLEKTIKIIFSGVDDLSKPIANIETAFGKINSSVISATQPLADFAAGIEKTDVVLAAVAVGGLVLAAQAYGEFESTMLKVKGVLNASSEDYDRLTAVTRDLGATTKYTAQQAAEGLLVLAQAGLDTDDAIVALPITLNLAQGAMIDVATASEIALKAMNNFGLGVGDLEHVGDVLLATANLSMSSVTELGEGMKMVSPIAHSLGMTIEETSAVLGNLADAGYKGEMGGTALRNILVALIAPTDNATKLFKEMGVDTHELGIDLAGSRAALESLGVTIKDESTGNMRAFPEIMDDIIVGLQRLPDPMDQTSALMTIFGKRGGPQMAALLEQGTGSIQDMMDKIKAMGNITQTMADDVKTSMDYAIKIVVSSLEGVALSIGKGIKDGVVAGSSGLSLALNAVVSEIDKGSFKPLFDLFNELGVDLGEFFKGVAAALPEAMAGLDFSDLVQSLQDLGDALYKAFVDVFGEIDFTKPEDLRDAMQKVIDVFELFINVNKGLVEGLTPFVKGLADMVQKFLEASDGVDQLVGKISGFAQGINSAGKMLEWIGPLFSIFTGATVLNVIANIGNITAGLAALAASPIIAGSVAIAAAIGSMQLAAEGAGIEFVSLRQFLGGAWIDEAKAAYAQVEAALEYLGISAADASDDIGGMSGSMREFRELTEDLDQDLEVQIALEAEDAKEQMQYLISDREQLLDFTEFTIGANTVEAHAKLLTLQESLDLLASGAEIPANVKLDPRTLDDANLALTGFMKDASGKVIDIRTGVEQAALDKVKTKLDTEIPKEKLLEIKLQGEIDTELAKIKANAESLQTAMEWTAKLEIATVEADAKRVVAAFENASSVISSISSEISSLMDKDWGKVTDSQQYYLLRDAAIQALKIQKETHEANMKLLDVQTKYEEAKLWRMQSNKALITIDSTGLEPALETIMWQILQKVQLKANEDQVQFLLGIQS